MSNIDYKAEVLRTSLSIRQDYTWMLGYCLYQVWENDFYIQPLSVGLSAEEAWQNAYEQLKKEGKIK